MAGTKIEIWFCDEARVGQQNKLTRRWAKTGTRPRATKDLRYMWAYMFGAVCPQRGVGAGLVMPYCNTQAFQDHLNEISGVVESGSHAVLIMDRAGWHTTKKLKVPKNITLLPLPPRSPELNPIENVWQYLKGRYLNNRVFKDYDHIVQACCKAWNALIEQPWRIMSIGLREWAMVD